MLAVGPYSSRLVPAAPRCAQRLRPARRGGSSNLLDRWGRLFPNANAPDTALVRFRPPRRGEQRGVGAVPPAARGVPGRGRCATAPCLLRLPSPRAPAVCCSRAPCVAAPPPPARAATAAMPDGAGAVATGEAAEEAAGGQAAMENASGQNQQGAEPPQYVEMSLDGRFGRVRPLPSLALVSRSSASPRTDPAFACTWRVATTVRRSFGHRLLQDCVRAQRRARRGARRGPRGAARAATVLVGARTEGFWLRGRRGSRGAARAATVLVGACTEGLAFASQLQGV